MNESQCQWCKALVPDIKGPVHPYIESSPGCWAMYGELLEREYADPALGGAQRLTVDAYAAQHPGVPSRQSARSVALHLMCLGAVFERGLSTDHTTRLLQAAGKRDNLFTWLNPPASLGPITVKDVWQTTDEDSHTNMVDQWARSVWNAWSCHHAKISEWLDAVYAN